MGSRLLARAVRLMIMQRLHEADPAGRLARDTGWDVLSLPMEFEPPTRCHTSIGFEDPRAEPGELLFPKLFDRERVEGLKKDLGSRASAAQLQQRPAPAEGTIFKRQWWKFYYLPGFEHLKDSGAVPLPNKKLMRQIQAWDLSFKDLDSSDFVAGHVWGRFEANSYLLDRHHDRMGAADTIKAIVAMRELWPAATAILIEDAANGPAVISLLKTKLHGIIAAATGGGKVARARAVEPIVEAGNVYLPHPECRPWVGEVLEEVAAFPFGANDDDVDALTHAIVRLHLEGTERYVQAMMAIGQGKR
jgi:predicted phage terminase large subunit-like protein